jgi:trehalose 6-phosphate synthase/phosphatase
VWRARQARESAIVLSKFVGCSTSLGSAVHVNPSNMDDVAEGISSALGLNERGKQMRQEKHVVMHDRYLQRASKDHASMNFLSVELAMNFRFVVLGPNFRSSHLSTLIHHTTGPGTDSSYWTMMAQ